MVLLFNSKAIVDFLSDLRCNGKNGRLRFRNSFLSPTNSDIGDSRIVGGLVNVDLSVRSILYLVDGRSTLPKDTGHSASWYSELHRVVGLLLEINGLS